MKNLKILMVALALLALPASAFGQTVSCEACTHDVSVFMGEGGLVATADGAGKVTWVSTCSGVTRSGTLTPNDDGMVAALFNMDNGVACSATGENMGSFQLGPVKDGGWFWITDEMNSAVGGLVSKEVQGNEPVPITSAGAGVTMTAGTGAVYLKETATGRVGILPTIVPEPLSPVTTKCGFTGSFSAASPGVPLNSSCVLGDGGTQIVATSTNGITGATVQIPDKGSVTRPAGSGSVSILMDVWGNGTGHYVASHDTASNGISAGRGHAALAGTAARASTRLTNLGYTVKVGTDTVTDGGSAVAGVTYTAASNAATFQIAKDASYCSKSENKKATVSIEVEVTDTGRQQVIPWLKMTHDLNADNDLSALADADRVHRVSTSFSVVCPGSASSSSHAGVELIPANLFPTE